MNNINLIRKIAWSFHHTTKEEWDDLFQEATLGYLHAMKTYDPKKSKLTTHVWNSVVNHLKTHLRKEAKTGPPICSLDDIEQDFPTESNGHMDQLSEDAQQMVKTVLMNPQKYSSLPPVLARWQVVRQMRRRGWNRLRIRAGLMDLKRVFSMV